MLVVDDDDDDGATVVDVGIVKKKASCQCLGNHFAFCRGANGRGFCVACCETTEE